MCFGGCTHILCGRQQRLCWLHTLLTLPQQDSINRPPPLPRLHRRGGMHACVHGLLKRNESLTRWGNATVVNIRCNRVFAVCLEAGRRLRIFPRCKSRKSLNYATFGRSQQDCRTLSGAKWLLSFLFFSPQDCLLPEDEKKDARLCEEWRSQHASERPVRGAEQSTVDPITADSTAALWRRAVHKQQPKVRGWMFFLGGGVGGGCFFFIRWEFKWVAVFVGGRTWHQSSNCRFRLWFFRLLGGLRWQQWHF